MQEELLNTRGSSAIYGAAASDQRRRVPGAPKKCYVVKEMWDMHHEIARRVVLGQKNTAIANALGVSITLVSNVKNSPVVMEKIDLLRGTRDIETVDIAKQIQDIAPAALDLLKEIISSGKVDEEVIPGRLRAHHAEKMLDRAGFGAPRIIQGKVLHGHFTSDDIKEIKERAHTLGIANGTVVEDEDIEDAIILDSAEEG